MGSQRRYRRRRGRGRGGLKMPNGLGPDNSIIEDEVAKKHPNLSKSEIKRIERNGKTTIFNQNVSSRN